ncbi:hypothetical protein VYU27_008067, partial [Nannochloropsis oceanica]
MITRRGSSFFPSFTVPAVLPSALLLLVLILLPHIGDAKHRGSKAHTPDANEPASFFSLNSKDGQQWSLTNRDGEYSVPEAAVPGTVHLDLIKSGILAEDPLYRDNELKYQWVCQDAWTYSTKVDLKSMKVADRDKDTPWMLQFDGIDTVASVTWNGKALPGSPPRSSFLQYTYHVPNDILAADGVNMLTVTIEPALEYTGKKGGREGGREGG